MVKGTVVSLHIAPEAEAPMVSVRSVRAVPGKGLESDRYHDLRGTFGKSHAPESEVTLIESEAIAALRRDYEIELDAGDSRRNIVTRGMALNNLVGRDFRTGEVTLRGIKLCAPCRHLERVTGRLVREGLDQRGGLRAQILAGGTIRTGDTIEVIETE